MSDLLFISMENWDDVWRRNQFFCAELIRRSSTRQIAFVGVQRNVARLLRARRLGELLSDPVKPAPDMERVTLTRPLRMGLERFAWGRRLNEAITRRHVRAVARRVGIGQGGQRPVLWLNPHYAVHMVGRMGEAAVIYDITDDWTSFEQSERDAELVRRQDAELCGKADAVIVCSQRLFEMKRDLVPDGRLHLIPNGVDAAHYREVLDGTGPLPAMAERWKRPVFGYTGTVHGDRVDVALVESIAKRMTRGTLVFVGPSHLSAPQQAKLEQTGRVRFTGAVPYAELPGLMRAFDVCVVPHRVTPFTESLNPIKLWEYLAAGLPIVATPVAGFRDYPEQVRLASDAGSFLAACEQALDEPREAMHARRAVAAEHSWSRRVDMVEAVLADVLAKRAAGEAKLDRDLAVVEPATGS